MSTERSWHTDVPLVHTRLRLGARIRSITAIIGVAIAALTGAPAIALEQPEYDVLAKTDAYELRRYPPYLVAEVEVTGSFGDSGRKAFRILADYIFGGNASDTRMAMTAPVETAPVTSTGDRGPRFADVSRGQGGGWVYAFIMERRFTRDSLPVPNDRRIRIVERPARTMAVRHFSGLWNRENVGKNEAKLLAALSEDGIDAVGAPVLARYNAPFMPWFLRRNEIMLRVAAERSANRP